MDEPEDDYDVGYGKPPRETQFGKGVSGNPKGRPKGSKNIATRFNEIASGLITVTEGGKTRTMTRLDAVLHQQMNSALKGDHRAIKETLQMQRVFEDQEEAEAIAPNLSSRDSGIMEHFLERAERMRKKPDQINPSCEANNQETQ